ncbi:glycosyl hydrolase family 65 protein [Microbacterium sp. NIBRBAC000506063]|uniref:glycosyl hydrolase family 65 protein n=1 Tax=Microbacterium sp. NIBRBAC000506063 TaxID=2734618 RepID=UPI0039810DB0
MRDHQGELSFDPRLPEDWPSLKFPLRWQGSRLYITVTKDALTVEVREGEPVSFSVRGTAYEVSDAVTIPLDGQGPVRPGRPTLRQIADARREDGTLLSASVPVTSALSLDLIAEEQAKREEQGTRMRSAEPGEVSEPRRRLVW